MRPLLVLLLIPALAQAQLPPIKLTVDPAPEARPALRYELLPNARDRVPGNAVLHYLRAHAARPPEEPDPAKRKAQHDAVLRWEDAPPAAFPAKEVAEHLAKYKALFREVEYGARCQRCDWASAPTTGAEAIETTLGSVQAHRELARWLSLRCKLEIAGGRTDDAIRTIQTGLQLGRHVTEGPTLIQLLVGVAIDGVFLQRLAGLMERPGAPNFYWALSTLPKPFLDIRPGLDGEDQLNERFLPGLAELRQGPVGPERALELTLAATNGFHRREETGGLGDIAIRIGLLARSNAVQDEARKELIARGGNAKEVAAMPAVQAVFLNSHGRYRELADDYRKWFLLGGPEAVAGLDKIGERVKKLKAEATDDTILQVFLNVLPAMAKTFEGLARTERRLAQLRAIEAIRLHAALAGRPPEALADIKKVPVPNDPLTGRPFEYARADGGFTLTAPELKGTGHLGQTFEVTLRAMK